jgi:hypothetical protein
MQNVNEMRGTFGFVQLEEDKLRTRCAVVVHVFTAGKLAGKLLIHYSGNSKFHAVIDRGIFKPSRDAYWSEGSWVEPKWEGDSARCTNAWSTKHQQVIETEDDPKGWTYDLRNPNRPANLYTDEEALEIYGPFVGKAPDGREVTLTDALERQHVGALARPAGRTLEG